jgi:hypothetical protein
LALSIGARYRPPMRRVMMLCRRSRRSISCSSFGREYPDGHPALC